VFDMSTKLKSPRPKARAQLRSSQTSAVQLAALADHQRLDQETGAFNSQLVIRMRARVSPSWPGPRGASPVTERRNCPVFVEILSGIPMFTEPRFC
jgi:hypothetical protein